MLRAGDARPDPGVSSEPPLHQLAHQIGAALLEAGQLVGLQAAHGQARQLIHMAAKIIDPSRDGV